MNRVDEIFASHSGPADFSAKYLRYIGELAQRLDPQALAAMIDAILVARADGAAIYFCGNGGSAATASHFANDIAIGTRSWDRPFRAISLTDNNAVVTAIANDDGYEHIFTQQLRVLLRPGDVVVAISASGNSPNVVAAVELAKARGNRTVALTGFDGGKLRELADICVHVPTTRGEYGPVEDMHMVVDHLIGAYLMRAVRAES